MWRRILSSRAWPVILLSTGAVALVDGAAAGHQIWPSLTRPLFYACLVIMTLCLPWSAYKRYRNLIDQRYIEPAPPVAGKCYVCGYDLTGNRSGTCPECGTAIVHTRARTPDIRDELRRYPSGDVLGIIIFGVMTVIGVLLAFLGHGNVPLLGIALAGMGAAGVLMCVVERAWMHRR